MEEDKKEKNKESVEVKKEESAQQGGGESQKHENTKTRKQEIKKSRNQEIEEKETEVKVETKEYVDSTDENEKEENPKTEEHEAKTNTIYPDVVPGANVKIHQKIKEKKGKEEKERIQIFEGIVLARKGGSSAGATISVKKICKGGFEVKKIYPIHSPLIAKIEVIRQAKVRQAKLGFLKREYKKKLKYKNQEIKKTIKQ